jgi:hypothetical protein
MSQMKNQDDACDLSQVATRRSTRGLGRLGVKLISQKLGDLCLESWRACLPRRLGAGFTYVHTFVIIDSVQKAGTELVLNSNAEASTPRVAEPHASAFEHR